MVATKRTTAAERQAAYFTLGRRLLMLATRLLDETFPFSDDVDRLTAKYAKETAQRLAVEAYQAFASGHTGRVTVGHDTLRSNERAQATYSNAIDGFEARIKAALPEIGSVADWLKGGTS